MLSKMYTALHPLDLSGLSLLHHRIQLFTSAQPVNNWTASRHFCENTHTPKNGTITHLNNEVV